MVSGRIIVFLALFLYAPQALASGPTKTGALHAPVDSNTLQYVTALFRHGEHTGDAATAYPNDPYINETYYPYGIGQLTSRGKERVYALGQQLRKRYDKFLENVYTPDLLEAITTDMGRTKASLLSLLAGLYPPIGTIMEWNSKLNWQPIPFQQTSFETFMPLTISIYFCANYAKEYTSYLSEGEGKRIQDKYANLYAYLRDNTGLNIQRTMEVFFVHDGLKAQNDWGLNLPDWTEQVWPKLLTEATIDGLASSVATTKLKQLSGGILAKRITENMKAKANNTIDPENRRLTLYSGHDLNIASLMGAYNVFTPHLVPYGACVLIELHKIGNEHYVKILYEDYTGDQPQVLTVPGCEAMCPLNKFEALIKVNFPEKDDPCGNDVSDNVKVYEDHQQQRDYYTGRIHYKSLIRRFIEWKINTAGKLVKGVVGVGVGVFDKGKDIISSINPFGRDKDKDKGGHRFPFGF